MYQSNKAKKILKNTGTRQWFSFKGHPGLTMLELLVGVNVIQEVMLIPVLSSFQQHKSIC